ncbi:hypothetical protein ACG04Q_23395 [Roseateles sp. DXS20W]|uniref:PNPLA domain-containing protein n=1 Tax=Pelomonas lactea TaxID=3299030 RepID=A0ABW7GRE1_9BURK
MLDTLLGGPPPARNRSVEALSWLAAGTLVVGLVLSALAQALRLPAGFGVEAWLGWQHADTLEAAACFWGKGLSRLPAAAAYLLIDTAVFMPLYGLTLLWALRQVRDTLEARPRVVRWVYRIGALSVLLLWVADFIENTGGLARLGVASAWGLVPLALAAPGFWLLRRWAAAPQRRTGLHALVWLALSTALMAAAALALAGTAPTAAQLAWIADSHWFSGWAHAAKGGLLGAALGLLLGLWLCWWFGLDLDSRPSPGPVARTRIEVRSACRQVALGVIGRSRYVLAVLGLFAAFTLVLDQCRDVLLALALPGPGTSGAWWWLAVLASALGLALLSHACWLWARLVGRIKRSGYEVSGLAGVATWAGEWARTWARLLMLAPLLMAGQLVATVAGDAVIAASTSGKPGDLNDALLRLGAFTLVIVALAWWQMRLRQLGALLRPSDYYNNVRAVRPLLQDPAYVQPDLGVAATAHVPPPLRGAGDVIHLLGRPVWQPLIALALLAGVRAVMLLMPDVTGTAPPALAVLALSLVWWLGPLGLIAMSEQRAVFPWALVLLGVVGIVGLWSDNHTLPALVIDNPDCVDAALADLRRVALGGLLLLALVVAAVWLLLTQRSEVLLGWLGQPGASADSHRRADRWRVGLGLLAAGVLCAGLAGMDRWARNVTPARETAAAPPPPAPPAAAGPLLLVASEGGGVRAAYWTARVLAGLQDADTGQTWMPRIAALSGVSGGSMGFAVWRACARGDRRAGTMTDCVRNGFANVDALSPLLAGLLFEDVLMRVLPTDRLCDADTGCGLRSRALAFEREWMRAFPRLAGPLGMTLPGEPDLLLNSTVVESGNRALMGTRRFAPAELPGAEDLLSSGRVPASAPAPSGASAPPREMPALVTAAHTSARFPLTNPLASLPRPASSAIAAAHLVDGGYHDNSGTATLSDWLTRLRKSPGADRDRPVQLVLIRNGQVRASCTPQALAGNDGEPPPDCLDSGSDARELIPFRDVQRLRLYADLFGPALTALNNLGTGAHAREPVAALTARVLPAGTEPPPDLGCTRDAPVCLLDQMQDAALVPLGWTLSPAARAALDARATQLVQQVHAAAK